MVESLDEGPVFDVSEVEICDSDNRTSLEEKLVTTAKSNIVDVIQKISNGLKPIPQVIIMFLTVEKLLKKMEE